MPAIELPTLADCVVSLPVEDARRNRELQRLVDACASAEAVSALHATAARAREGVLATVLTYADAVLGGLHAGSGSPADHAAAHDGLRVTVSSPEFLALVPDLILELRQIASARPETGACTVATALELWGWTMTHFLGSEVAKGPAGVADELAEALCPLLAARCLALAVIASTPAESEFHADLSCVHAARASAAAGGVCAELVFGYRQHLAWDAEGCAACYSGDDIDDLEGFMPGIASGARMSGDVLEADGSHPAKRGPCATFEGVEPFLRLRNRLDRCLTGARTVKDRAAAAIARSTTATTTAPSKGRA